MGSCSFWLLAFSWPVAVAAQEDEEEEEPNEPVVNFRPLFSSNLFETHSAKKLPKKRVE